MNESGPKSENRRWVLICFSIQSLKKFDFLFGRLVFVHVKSSQISFIAWKIRKMGEASADTAATEAHYMKGYYNLEEETIKVKIWAAKSSSTNETSVYKLVINADFKTAIKPTQRHHLQYIFS